MNHYKRPEWSAFRDDVIRLHDGTCNRCLRGPADGAVLQVHHNTYIAGHLPWEYQYDQCEALCRGCHAQEHGKIMPRSGWVHFGFCDDLGDLDGTCELCGTSIRYVFPIFHQKWGTMEVGEICCDHLTSTTFATEHMKHVERRKRFVSSSRWYTNKSGTPCIKQDGILVRVMNDGTNYRLQMNDAVGRRQFESLLAAKMAAYDVIVSGKAGKYLRKARLHAPS